MEGGRQKSEFGAVGFSSHSAEHAMGNRMSRIVVGCFSSERHEKYAHGLHFSEPLDEGLGHSFCYVRPVLGSPTLSPHHGDSRDISPPALDLALESADAAEVDSQIGGVSDELPNLEAAARTEPTDSTLRSQLTERPRVGWEKGERVKHNERAKSMTETSFKSISGASVSANTATPRSVASQEQFNSFSNVPIERAAAFESTASFSALPLQRIANSGPISGPLSGPASGPLDRGLQSGPLERGFMSGPLERGFMSGPIERGFMSGPLEPVDRNTFSAPLAGPHPSRKKSSLRRFVRSMSLPMRKAIARTVSKTTATLTRTIVIPVRHFVMGDNHREGDRDFPHSAFDSPIESGSSGSDLDIKDDNNLQWAQGKAGEDRVHVVLSEEHGWLFVGIYDGFNGPDAPDFLMSNLYPAIYRELKGLLWNQKSAFELGDGSPSDGEGDVSDARNARLSGDDERAGGDFISRLGHSCSSDPSLEGQKGCASNLQSGLMELSRPGTSALEEVGRDGREDPGGNGCQSRNHLEWPSEETAHAVDLRPDNIDNCPGQPSREVDTIVNHGNEKHSEEHRGKHMEGHLTCDLSTRESKCDLDLGLEQEGELDEDRIDAEGIEQDLSSIVSQVNTPEPIGSSNVHLAENTSVKDHSILNMKLQVLHNRRREQHRKYPQWRYEWEQERLVEEERMREKLRLKQEAKEMENNTVDHDAVLKALSRALEATEEAYLDMTYRVLDENPELALMGSCVLVMLMKDEDVYILNVGDSRAIIAQDCRRGSFNSLSKLARNQLNGYKAPVDEHERIGARDSLLRQELERIIEETPTEIEALETHDPNLGPPPPGLSLLGALQLTSDHSTSTEEEVQRLRAEHPFDDDIISNDRVKGRLKVTRAFGAGFLKQPRLNNVLFEMFRCKFIGNDPYINCDPCLRHHKLGPQDRFLVLSSDGLYQYLTNEEVVSHVEWFMERCPDGDPAQRLIEELLFRAAKKNGMELNELLDIPQGDRRKYHDDVSVMVISLEGRIWRSSGSLKHST
ncbi:hypothetical protein M758_1G300800 [Ceratodon purpureus]|nr:hypothetical protein M758_1G300800 [Ceratodon purpureus]